MNNDFQIITLDAVMEKITASLSGLKFDIIVAVGRGGILPGYLASRLLDIPLEILYLTFRDDTHKQIYNEPLIKGTFRDTLISLSGKKILLTDDVSNSGATINKAKSILKGNEITTLVISGNADISLYGPHEHCIKWPWSI